MQLSLEPQRHIYRVSELNAVVQRLFESSFRNIYIAGEISGCRMAASGHYYFALKDAESQLKCVLFKSAVRAVRFKPQDGLSVLARGSVEVYEARGEYQLLVESLEPQGAGALQLAFEQLKAKLAGEGLFDQARKRALPKFPRRIGIVTSSSGAVLRDILHVLERRFPGLHLRIFPVNVQGEGSVEQVCRALQWFSTAPLASPLWADVVIVARGGGSLEDLWTFNEEAVARAIAACSIPVISAIGHETDFTIADFVADCRAPTPSVAAEIVICTKASLLEQIEGCRKRAVQNIQYRLVRCSRDLHQQGTTRAGTLIARAIAKRMQRVDELDYQLRAANRRMLEARSRHLAQIQQRLRGTDLRLRFARNRHREEQLNAQLRTAMHQKLDDRKRRLTMAEAHLRQLSPLNVLSRGYAIVESANGAVLRSSAETAGGDALRVRLHRGELDAVVTETRVPASQ
jgi:exodeoxyribonuclease VII large subunit